MTERARKFDVNPGQVIAAREYIRRIGNPALVAERIVTVANLPLDEVQDEWDNLPLNEEKIQAARALIALRGGEKYVDPLTIEIAHATLPDAAEVDATAVDAAAVGSTAVGSTGGAR